MSLDQPPSEVRIDERLVVRESPIAGRGLFFAERLAAAVVVISLGGVHVSSVDLDERIAKATADPLLPYVDTITIDEGVQAGEEATIDYGTQSGAEGFEMSCTCHATSCRGLITSDDWRRADIQRRYRGHWVTALQHRIDALRPRP